MVVLDIKIQEYYSLHVIREEALLMAGRLLIARKDGPSKKTLVRILVS